MKGLKRKKRMNKNKNFLRMTKGYEGELKEGDRGKGVGCCEEERFVDE